MILDIRLANLGDSISYLNLRNSFEVRSSSLSSASIDKNQHVMWFHDALKSTNNIFFTIIDVQGNFHGYIRYVIEGSSSTVSIALSKDIRGKGLAKSIMENSINRFLKMDKVINEIKAVVNSDNIASKKLFERCGFKLMEKYMNKGFVEYVYDHGQGLD